MTRQRRASDRRGEAVTSAPAWVDWAAFGAERGEPRPWRPRVALERGAHLLAALAGGDLHVIGSARLVQALIGHNLVDEFRLMIDPVLVGGGNEWSDATGGVEHSLTNNVWRSLRG